MNQITDYKQYNKIAVMGGTFNPIHNGHLVAAESVRQQLGIDRVIFIPTGKPPHKNMNLMFNEHRYLMTVLATVTNPHFEVSRIEIDRAGLTYTIDTIIELKNRCNPDCKIYFITGADAIKEILKWKSPEKLLSMCEFVAVTRPGYNKDELQDTVNNLKDNYKGKITFLEIPALSISSTDIRHRVLAGQTIKYLVPNSVEEYILKFNLYSADNICSPEIEAINAKLHSVLTPKRYKHTQGVAQESLQLAKRYGADTDKAYMAGLLHDCAKCFTDEEKLELCDRYGLILDDILKSQPDLTHSFLGAKIAKEEYGINDSEVLDAIAYHTTGRPNMSILEKIVFIADYIEPNRDYFEGLDKVRELAYKDINKAIIYSLENTINYNKNKNRIIHPLGIAALDYIKEEENE